jgi:hippurate hydrolase
MTIPIAKIRALAQELAPEAVALRRAIHAHPELGLELPETKQRVLAALEGLPLVVRGSQSTSSLVATLECGAPGPTLLLRADMDALPMPEDTGLAFCSTVPGRMHACGHDAHTAMLAASARMLCDLRGQLRGRIHLFFQSGEEGHFGARYVLEEGLLDGSDEPDAVFAIHVDPRLPVGQVATRPGPLLASADVWSVTLKGRGGHASMPHDTLDPVPVACEIVGALQTFVTRRIDAFDPVVLTTTKIEAGTTNNVIPENAYLLGTLRSTSTRARDLSHQALHRIPVQIAAAHELEAEVTIDAGYPVTVNDAEFFSFTRSVADELVGTAKVHEMGAPVMGAEDFSYLLERWPGAMVFLGVRPEGGGPPAPCHSNRMMLNEAGMETGIALHAAIPARYLAAPPS